MNALIKRPGIIQTTDWFVVITDLQRFGIPMMRIGQAMGGVEISDKMLHHYRAGTEPLHWRGQLLLEFWCKTFTKELADRPMREVTRGRYRAEARAVQTKAEHAFAQEQADQAGPNLDAAETAAELAVTPKLEPEVVARRKPGPKPGSKRKTAEVV